MGWVFAKEVYLRGLVTSLSKVLDEYLLFVGVCVIFPDYTGCPRKSGTLEF